jgi:hypothetical protein
MLDTIQEYLYTLLQMDTGIAQDNH